MNVTVKSCVWDCNQVFVAGSGCIQSKSSGKRKERTNVRCLVCCVSGLSLNPVGNTGFARLSAFSSGWWHVGTKRPFQREVIFFYLTSAAGHGYD